MRTALLFLLALPAFAAPKLLLNSADIDRIRKTAATEPWAKAVVRDLVKYADEWPAQHVREYGLTQWELPREGSGWSHDYVCPVHGVRLHPNALPAAGFRAVGDTEYEVLKDRVVTTPGKFSVRR